MVAPRLDPSWPIARPCLEVPHGDRSAKCLRKIFGIDVPPLTEPSKPLLDPEGIKQGAHEFMELACPLLREMVNFSSHALRWTEEGMATLPKDVGWAPLRLHYQVIEMVDGVEVLLREACAYPAMGPLRSAFEADLYLGAIHSHPDFNAASLTWLVGQVKRHIGDLRRKSPDYGLPKTKIVVCDRMDDNLYREIKQSIEGLERALAEPHLRAIAAQARLPWYRALWGANSLRELSTKLDEQAQDPADRIRAKAYKFLYGRYANTLHGSDFERMFRAGEDERPWIAALRNPTAMAEVARVAAGMVLDATRLQVRRFRPDKENELVEWYATKVRDRFMTLSTMDVKVNWISIG